MLCIITKNDQSINSSIKQLLANIAQCKYAVNNPLPLKSTSNMDETYNHALRRCTPSSIGDVNLKKIILSTTNNLAEEQSELQLEACPGPTVNLY